MYIMIALMIVLLAPAMARTATRYGTATWQPVIAEFERALPRDHVVGLSVAVVDGGQIVWARGFGYADRARKMLATPETIYRTGALAKLLTATAVMQLVDQHKIALDQPLQAYLPDFAIRGRVTGAGSITVRSVLCHHAGLSSQYLYGYSGASPMSFTGFVPRLRNEYTAFPPGQVLCYSDVGYGLLGHLVQQVSKTSYTGYMDRAVLRPLGMTNAAFSVTPAIAARLATSYAKGQAQAEVVSGNVPACHLYADVNSLAHFLGMALSGGRAGNRQIISAKSLAEMTRPQGVTPLDFDVRIGLGWFLGAKLARQEWYNGPVWFHGSDARYQQAIMLALPREKIGVVILANSAEARDTIDGLAGTVLRVALQAKTGRTWPADHAASLPPVAQADAKLADVWSGQYAAQQFGTLSIFNRAERLYLRSSGLTLELVPHAGGVLTIKTPRLLGLFTVPMGQLSDARLTRAKVAGQEALVLDLNGARMLAGVRIQETPIPDAWRNRVGRYEPVSSADAAVREVILAVDSGILVARVRVIISDPISLFLKPLDTRTAVVLGLGRGFGDTVSVVAGVNGQDDIRYAGCRLRRTR